jgi:hypothetical protein
MDYMTAEQAAEAARGLTFEKVWAALMETRQRQEESGKRLEESYKRLEESHQKLKESQEESDKRLEESYKRQEESRRKAEEAMQKTMSDLSKNLGGLGNSLGRVTEAMFSAELCKKFDDLGFTFNTQANHKRFRDSQRQTLAEVDSVLENGDYVMLVEIKTDLSAEDVDDHLARIDVVRQYMDAHGDKRKIVGAAAGAHVPDNVLRSAQKKGLFVIVQSGDAVEVAAMPQGFKAREWRTREHGYFSTQCPLYTM